MRSGQFYYQVGDKIEYGMYSLIIQEQIRITHRKNMKGYICKCSRCETTNTIDEYSLRRGNGCSVCSTAPKRIIKEKNSLWATHQEYVKYLTNIEDSHKYSAKSEQQISITCPQCHFTRKVRVYNLTNHGFSCTNCGDGISYPEKMVSNVLKQLGIEFHTQYSPEWIKPRKYDFYIPLYNMIIEVHGEQHYKEKRWKASRTLAEEQQNDREKETLAIQHGITQYIVVNCSKSSFQFIKENICNSLANYFDLSCIDWDECNINATTSNVLLASNLFNDNVSIKEIATILNVNRNTVSRYLKKATEIGWCNYDVKEVRRNASRLAGENSYKKVRCIETGDIFNGCVDVEKRSLEVLGVQVTKNGVSCVCSGKQRRHRGYTFEYIQKE